MLSPLAPLRRVLDRAAGRTRRTWAGDGRYHVEYRRVDAVHAVDLARRVREVVAVHEGVLWVEVNPFVHRVVVGVDPDRIDLADLVALVERVEAEFGVSAHPFPPDRPDHPADLEPALRELVQLLSDLVGVTTTIYGQARRMAPLRAPVDVSWLLTLLENVPQLRASVEQRLGERATDLVLGVTNSLLRGVSLGWSGHVVDVTQRVARLRHLAAARSAWERREPELHPGSDADLPRLRAPRRCPLPDGPIERYSDQSWGVSVGGFVASLLATDDVERAAAPLLDGIPKAARLGRSAFVSQLVRVLAERGVLVLEAASLHALDRVTTVVIDGDLVSGLPVADGVGPATAALTDEGAALVAAAREAGLGPVVVGRSDGWPIAGVDLVPRDRAVAEMHTHRHHDELLLGIGTGGGPLFEEADIAVGVYGPDTTPPWEADVLCTGEIADALVLVEAVPVAARNSRQAVTLSFAGAGIGASTALGGIRSSTPRQVLRVVDMASLLAMGNGIRLASELATVPASLRRDQPAWHRLDVDEVLQLVGSRPTGLSEAEWAERHVPPPRQAAWPVTYGRAVGEELANPLTPVLGAGAALSFATGSVADAGLVASVVVLNAAIGAAQRLRTEQAVRRLFRQGRHAVTVVREGTPRTVPASTLVVGDVVELEAGEAVPADCRIITADSLEVDESSLTGESLPVRKKRKAIEAEAVADRRSMLHQTTTVAAGGARAVVVAIGDDTEAQRAVRWAVTEPAAETGVEARLEQLTRVTVPLALLSGAGVSLVGLVRRVPARELVDASVGLAVAAVPEGLPLLANAAQHAAARRLSHHGVLVRSPRAIEALGRVDVVCADKTGTLTEGTLQLVSVSDGRTETAIDDASNSHARVLLTARRATPVDPDGAPLPHPTDQAVADGTRTVGVSRGSGGAFAVLDDLPFEPGRSYHAVLADTEEGRLIALKGAPEEVLRRSSHWLHPYEGHRVLTPDDRVAVGDEAERLASHGMRVLAVAERPHDGKKVKDRHVEALTFVGLLGLRDPVRAGAADAVARLQRAGVAVIMITGDHPTTASRIATDLGLPDGLILTGPEVDGLDDARLDQLLEKVTVFARVTPLHKVRIVRGFQRLGRTVAMTGDGANDAPAIRLADVGIAVGTRATAAARETADMVVVDDRLEVILDAVAEGRGLWGSVRDAVAILVGGNLGEIAYTLLGSLVGRRPPLNTRQLLLVNLLTDVAPAMALAVREPRASMEHLLREGPDRSLGEALNRALVWRGAGAALGATTTYAMARLTGTPARARTAGLVALVGAQLGQTIATSGGDLRVVATGVGSFVALAAVLQTPGVSQLAGSRPMGPVGWLTGLTGAAVGTAVGAAGPRLEGLLGPEQLLSGAVLESLVQLEPTIPGIVEPSDSSISAGRPW